MEIVNCMGNLVQDLSGLFLRQHSFQLDVILKVHVPIEVLHNKIPYGPLLVRIEAEDSRYIWVLELLQQSMLVTSIGATVLSFTLFHSEILAVHVLCNIYAGVGPL